tara:strand:- start:428 stop:1189 length:762 start_codon:yes stop_codon:yes gene_type:complete
MKPQYLIILLLIAGCNPLDYLYKEINKYGYIPLKTPLALSGPGTLVAGNPDSLSIVAPPGECFPFEIDGDSTNFRFVDTSTLPKKIRNITASGSATVDLIELGKISGAPIDIGVDYDRVETISLELDGVSIEYMNAPQITNYYQTMMDPLCRMYLDFSGFIFQAIKVEKLNYTFYSKDGAKIDLSTGALEEILELGADIEFDIENKVELIIKSPHYIGFQLGSMQESDSGISIKRASKIKRGDWHWENLNVFD